VWISETGGWETPLYVNVVGTWDRKRGWHELTSHRLTSDELGDGPVARRLAAEGTTWTLYRLGQPIVAANSQTAIVVPGIEEDWETAISWSRIHAPLDDMSPSLRESCLAISSVRRIDVPTLRLLPPEDNLVDDLVRTALRKLGRRPGFKVAQNVVVDLDGDGRTDRLIALELPEKPDPPVMAFAMTGAMILAMFERSDGDTQTTVVREPTGEPWGPISQANILAVVDMNGDGFCEIAIEVYAPDLSAYELYHYDGGQFEMALHWLKAE
jgi:hypothetical protein